jgi:hypothetical protein
MLLHGYSLLDADYVSWYWNWLIPLLSSGGDGIVDIAPRLQDGRSRVLIPVGKEIFIFSKTCRTSLCPTQPPVQWIPKYSLEDKVAGR